MRGALFVVVSLLAGAPGAAGADPKADAKVHAAKASELFRTGQLEQALGELTAAYALDPVPELLYAMGQIHTRLGRCDVATSYYQRFLAARPTERSIVQEALTACIAAFDPSVEQPPVAVDPPPALPTASRAWYQDKVTLGLFGGGVVMGAMSALVYGSARGDIDEIASAATYPESRDLLGSARSKRIGSVVLGVGGAALIGVAVVRIASRGPEAGVSIAPTAGGAMVTWSGSLW